MPKKGSRLVDVDGRKFRWKLNSSPVQEDDDGRMPVRNGGTITLQEDCPKPGHVLQHELTWHTMDSVSPEFVRELIRRALIAGWDPASRSKFRLFGQRVIVDHIIATPSVVKHVMEQ